MKKIFFVLLAAMLTQPIFSQYYYHNNKYYESDLTFEIGGSIGMMNCLTDLGGRKGIGKGFIKDLNLKNSNFDAGVFFMASYQNKVAVRLEATMGSIEAYDSILKKVKTSTYGRYERNLSFRSEIRELQLSVEVHPLFILNNYDEEPPRFSPYAIAGIGLFSFDPEAKLDGNWIRLQPLRTEGQGFREYRDRKPYHLTQFNFPVGIGVRYELNDNLNVRMELVHQNLYNPRSLPYLFITAASSTGPTFI